MLLPSYIIYKAEHVYAQWCLNGQKGAPCCTEECCKDGTFYNRTKSVWIDFVTFTDFLKKVFLPHACRLEGRKVLIGDNLCEENDIAFSFFVPNSTQLSQPLDQSFFWDFKEAWRRTLMRATHYSRTTTKLGRNDSFVEKL